jgi:hypothetical protein
VKTLYALALGLLLALGCGDRGSCGCENLPCEIFTNGAKAVALKCNCAPFFCCDTCEGDEDCLNYCIERKEQ